MPHWHTLAPKTLEKEFETNIETGLTSAEAQNRLKRDGPNALPDEKRESVFVIFARQFQSPLIYLLGVASMILFALGEHMDGGIILFVLVFNSILGAIHDGRAQETLRRLRDFITTNATVIRNNEHMIISDSELVVGDIILVQEGERIGADARIIEEYGLKIDESAITGESGPIHKTPDVLKTKILPLTDQRNILFRGTAVLTGNAKAIVVATGIKTEIGNIGIQVAHISTEMPLKRELGTFSRMVIIAAGIICGGIFLLGIIMGKDIIEMFESVVALSVSVIPEGLPIVMTVILANGVWHMAKRNALVKKLHAVEALGQAQVIAVDKTGTLTRNELVIRKLFLAETEYDVTGSGYEPKGAIFKQGEEVDLSVNERLTSLISFAAVLSNAELAYSEQSQSWKVSGDPTEAAMLALAHKTGLTKEHIAQMHPKIAELPFSFQTKYHAVLTRHSGSPTLAVGGAPETILSLSSHIASGEKDHTLKSEDVELVEQAIQKFSRQGLRIIAVAMSKHPNLSETLNLDPSHVSNLTFIGLFGFHDSIREEVPSAVQRALDAGIRVVMLTGDHMNTARALAQQANIYHDGDLILSGTDIERMTKEELKDALARATVCARVTPEHKMRLIEGYRARGEIIAMTGDGVNDAPALVAADLGIGMGKQGTEVAKEASDILLLDDNFASIIAAIEEGRSIYKTLKKVILYLVSTNLSEVIAIALALVVGLPLPLVAAQIIWLNLVTDSFLDVSLGMEPKERNLLSRMESTKHRSIVDAAMVRRVIVMSTPMGLTALAAFIFNYQDDLQKGLTLCMTTLAVSQWLNAWNCRSEYRSIFRMNPFSNRYLVGALIIVASLQLLAIYHPFLNTVLRTTPLSPSDWLMVGSFSLFVVLFEEIRKAAARKRMPRFSLERT